MMEWRVEPDLRQGLGKHGKTCLISYFLSRPILPSLDRTIVLTRPVKSEHPLYRNRIDQFLFVAIVSNSIHPTLAHTGSIRKTLSRSFKSYESDI